MMGREMDWCSDSPRAVKSDPHAEYSSTQAESLCARGISVDTRVRTGIVEEKVDHVVNCVY